MKRKYTISILALALILAIGGGVYYQKFAKKVEVSSGLGSLDLSAVSAGQGQGAPEEIVPGPSNLSQSYKSDLYPFSFKYPTEYSVNEIKSEDGVGNTTVLQDGKGNGFQIVVSPFDEPGSVLTKERIQADIPDLVISESQEVTLGANGRGVAFKSDNELFGGASREVWFVFDGNLYQISTYIRNDLLLQAVLGTWEFRR